MKHIYLCLIDKTEIKQFDLKIPRSPYIQGSLVSVRAREDRDVIEFLWDIVFHNETIRTVVFLVNSRNIDREFLYTSVKSWKKNAQNPPFSLLFLKMIF